MALAALIISIVSAIAAVGAVGVTVWTHKQQGSRIKCQWRYSMPVGTTNSTTFVSVEAVNEGRSPTTIEGWGFAALNWRGRPGDSRYAIFPTLLGPTLPHRVEAETSAAWRIELETLMTTIQDGGHEKSGLTPFVRMATGKEIFGKTAIKPSSN
jgi:hypothetical protein